MASCVVTSGALAASQNLTTPSTSFHLNVTTESVSNLGGGLATGTAYDTLVHTGFSLDTQAAGLWGGGRLWLDLAHVSSGQPSVNLVGDFQTVSNIAAPSANRVYEFWYRQYLGNTKLKLRAGYIDLNKHFAVVPYASQIINASWGILPAISGNVSTSIYPKPGAGMILSDSWSNWHTGIGLFQGHPETREYLFGHGYMLIGELGYHDDSQLPHAQQFKFGLWQYSQPDAARDGGPGSAWGSYAIWSRRLTPLLGSNATHSFMQIGASPTQSSITPYYLGTGLALQGVIKNRPQDVLSMSISRVWVRDTDNLRPETSYEINYLWQFNSHFALQPDLQYVTQPSGTSAYLPNAWVAILRLYLSL